MAENEPITRDTHFSKGVIASVIASLIVIILIQPILRLAWSFMLTLGSRFLQSYIDSIYRSAALGHRNYVDVMLLIAMLSILCGITLGATFAVTHLLLHPKRCARRPGKPHLLLLWLLVVLLHLVAISVVVGPYVDLQLNTSFQQRLKVLAPKLTDLEMKEFEASWASMQNRGDFDSIRSKMESTAKKYGITLPKPLLK